MNKDELDEILAKHKLWLEGKPNGERANLREANYTKKEIKAYGDFIKILPREK